MSSWKNHAKLTIAVSVAMKLFECGNLTIHHKCENCCFNLKESGKNVPNACCRVSDLVQLIRQMKRVNDLEVILWSCFIL